MTPLIQTRLFLMAKTLKHISWVFSLCALLWVNAWADLRFPTAESVYINDFASVLSPVDTDRLEETLSRLEHQTGIQFSVVTIRTLNDYGASDISIQDYADRLMDDWGVGDSEKNDGIVLLFSLEDRNVAISMGAGYQHRYDSQLKNVVDNTMLPYFRQGEYSRGIYEGVAEAISVVTVSVSWFEFYKWHLLAGVLIVICIAAGISCMRNGKKGWGWMFFSIAFVILLFLIRVLLRGKSKGGFGGGRSGGGGASGSW